MTTSAAAPGGRSPLSLDAGPDANLRRLHRAAAVRIAFGLVWAIDASFKWLPGFIHGKTLSDELGQGSTVHAPGIHQWIQAWHGIATASPQTFAICTAVIESCIALCLILGLFSTAVFIGSALYSLGIWSTAEAFGLPWTTPGITDLGPSVAYIFASLSLLHAYAGATWSMDTVLRPHLGRLAWLSSPTPRPATT